MKLARKKGKGLRVVNIDGNRRSTLNKTLTKISDKNRRNELAASGKTPPVSLSPASTTKLTVRMNASGNMRGMNPSSLRTPEEMKRIRSMRKLYSKMMPSPQCNACAFSSNCPQFRAGYECAFLPFLNSHQIESIDDLVAYMEDLLGSNMRRTHMGLIMETLSGGSPSIETSEQIALLFGQLKELHNLKKEAETAAITLETSDDSIIGRLFGGMDSLLDSTKQALKNPIDVPALIVRESGGGESSDVDFDVSEDFRKMELAKDVETGKGGRLSNQKIIVTKLAQP